MQHNIAYNMMCVYEAHVYIHLRMKTAAIATNILLLCITYCVCAATDYYNVLRFGYDDSVDQFETKVHDSQSHDRIDGHASCI